MQNFDNALQGFLNGVKAISDSYFNKNFSNNKKNEFSLSHGNRYIRVISDSHGQKSLYCFIDSTNGDILKGSWKAPVKNGVRGNIFKENFGLDCCDWHGPKYLR